MFLAQWGTHGKQGSLLERTPSGMGSTKDRAETSWARAHATVGLNSLDERKTVV